MALDFTPIDPNKFSSLVDLERYAEHGSTLVNGLNYSVTQKFGIDIVYFRATPHKNSTDVIFQDYTLYGVDPCSKVIKGMLSDPSYAMGDYTVSIYELNYNIPLDVQIDITSWFSVFGSGTMPQKYDILYVPMLHKIFEVDSTQEVYGFMEKLTHFKVVLKKYNPKQFRNESEELIESIQEYTTGILELIGEDIDTEIKDLVVDDFNSMFTSTALDDYKYVEQSSYIIHEKLSIRNLDVFQSYYDLQQDKTSKVAVEYKTSDSFDIHKGDARLFTCWFRLKSSVSNLQIESLEYLSQKVRIDKIAYETLLIRGIESNKLNPKQIYKINSGAFINFEALYSHYDNSTKAHIFYIKVVDRVNLDNKHPNWKTSKNFSITVGNTISLIQGVNTDKQVVFDVSFNGTSFVDLRMNNSVHHFKLNTDVKINEWYAMGLYLNGTDNFLKLYKIKSGNLHLVNDITNIEYEDLTPCNVHRYQIPNNSLSITRLRMYNLDKPMSEAQLKMDLKTDKLPKNSSKLIFNDSVKIPNQYDTIYNGVQR